MNINIENYIVGNINHLYLKIAKLNKINKKKNYSKNLMSFNYDINLRKYLKTIIKLI